MLADPSLPPPAAGPPSGLRCNGDSSGQESRLAPLHVCEYAPTPRCWEASEGLRRRLADIDSGRVETIVYPGADEYIEHLRSMLDG